MLSRKQTLHFLTTVNQQKYGHWQSNRAVGIGFLKLLYLFVWHGIKEEFQLRFLVTQ